MSLDKYGILQLNPTTGFEWFNTWDNGHARTWSPPSKNWAKQRNQDPDDSFSDLHCKPEERKIKTQAIVDGKGILTLVGTTPRLYISDPNEEIHFLNVEMTVYFYIVRKLAKGGAYVACRLCGRTNHHLIEPKCSAAGTGYASEVKNSDGTWQQRRENGHAAYSVNNVYKKKGVSSGKWYGLKHVIQNVDNNSAVRVATYRDLTEGLNGGEWGQPLLEKFDRGDWKFSDKAEYKKVNSCSGFPKVATNKPQLIPQLACYLRCDNNEVRYKYFSIREI